MARRFFMVFRDPVDPILDGHGRRAGPHVWRRLHRTRRGRMMRDSIPIALQRGFRRRLFARNERTERYLRVRRAFTVSTPSEEFNLLTN